MYYHHVYLYIIMIDVCKDIPCESYLNYCLADYSVPFCLPLRRMVRPQYKPVDDPSMDAATVVVVGFPRHTVCNSFQDYRRFLSNSTLSAGATFLLVLLVAYGVLGGRRKREVEHYFHSIMGL